TLFVEQLAVPGLLVGGGALGFGLFRDLSPQAAAAVLALVALGVAALIARPWLRVLLGAAAAVSMGIAFTPALPHLFGRGQIANFWIGWHLTAAVWLAAIAAQQSLLVGAARARAAAAVESLSAGAVLATLAALAWWSGSSFLVGGVSHAGRELADVWRISAESTPLRAGSAALALAAALWLARAWPGLRRAWSAAVALVLVGLAAFMPALGMTLLLLACCATLQRERIAGAAALAAAWIVGSFYYQLAWPLATKAVVLVAAGAVLAALAWLAVRGEPRTAATPAHLPQRPARWGIALSAVAALVVANAGIWQKERLIAEGQPVFVELAPVDPRSLMQGDYMALNFRLPSGAPDLDSMLLGGERPSVVGRRGPDGVFTALRFDDRSALASDELRIELTPKDGRWTLVSDAWYVREGEAERWAKAKYGEFRVDRDGHALLVGLRDAQLRPL
ncbi:MAG TPA: GDYXXLXY domain-containing protein, partial [Albitalea sp.]|nr:GDYXXLXY domain-containing protein [Albitalea sp.]